MSAQRVLVPLTSSSILLKFAPISAASTLRPCQHVLRSFSVVPSYRASSKRKMQTATAYQPFQEQPPPPRNIGIPETSIAGGLSQVKGIKPTQQLSQHGSGKETVAEDQSNISLTEAEAQKSTPTAPAPKLATKPRTKLRARKAAMKLTPGAVAQLRALMNQPEPKIIKVGVKNKGCSGLAYHLEYVDKPGTFDEMVEQDGVKVLIDSKALMSIIGTEMDWVEDKLEQRFVFNNPNIKESCGCGESFMV
ncbi:hypothetical protein BJ878DRAFT_411375 [Calycina marina]|uniref:Iron-sulfur assembly protein 1 n=1 Tax=Calycina marina TaxID=1763456 RepID=A0A9P8CJ55_9HELO|nr:hypothetical protein BJ878DRAFT_411375 [Calycina marina]